MSNVVFISIAFIGGAVMSAIALQRRSLHYKREHFIRTYKFSQALLESLQKIYPTLQVKDQFLVARALRHFLIIHLHAKGEAVAMPSKVVDALWHEFILDTRGYHAFCERAYGTYFHHVPAALMRPGASSDAAMRKTWRLACLEENIAPKSATRLPLLFAIDSKLSIPNGNTYSLNRPVKAESGSCGSGCGGYACSGAGLAGGDSCSSGGGDGDGGGCSGGCGGGD